MKADPSTHRILAQLYRRMAAIPILLLSGVLAALCILAFAVLDAVAKPATFTGPVSLQLAFSAGSFRSVLSQWGPAGIDYYRMTMWVDYIFPVAYGVFLSSGIALLSARVGHRGTVFPSLFVCPLVAGSLDLLENTLHLVILADSRILQEPLVVLAALAATGKWGLLAVSLGAIILDGARILKARWAGR